MTSEALLAHQSPLVPEHRLLAHFWTWATL